MSGTISCGCFHPTVGHHVEALDRNDKGKACTSCYQNTSTCRPRKEKFQKLKTRVSRKFWEKSNCLTDSSCFQKAHRNASLVPRAVMVTSPKPEQTKKFNIDGQSELEIQVTGPDSILSRVTVRIYNGSPTLVLHWGAIRSGQKNWSLPSCQPQGTKVYKNRALRTPFVKSGPNSLLEIEVNDPEVEALEFLLVDEAENKWFKNGGGNFRIELERKSNQDIPISIPQDLLQIQAYLRWERMGKQNYTPEREKEEFEAARRELIDKVTGGASIDDIRAELTGKNTTTTPKEDSRSSGKDIPNDLIQIQAYIRWEKAGKPTYSKEKQLVEFDEAKHDLEMEVAKGTSLEQIRKRMLKGDIETKVSKQLKKGYFSPERINRKKRDINKLITKYRTDSIDEKLSAVPTSLTPLERYSMSLEEQFGDKILNKKFFQIDGGQLLVLVTKSGGAIKAYIAADAKEPLILHWALSETPGEWKRPPLSILPPGSVLLEKASESEFQEGSSGDLSFKYMEIEFTEGGSVGMPFVLRAGEKWIKNSGSDFYVDFAADTLKARKSLGDGKGTAKALLNKIAQMESDAERSLMHRFNIANDLTQSAKNEGMLGIAAILVWMRFMATRQLTWNKNYNVKPREISRAQDSLTDSLQKIYQAFPQCREIVRMILSTVGRGGQGDVGQRIRDEILVIQRNNDCKGGMMEEWHQKLHNNTSPDDVVICQALLDYISSDFDVDVYWKTLNSNGITKERLLSYDRAIHSEPNFKHDQKEGLIRDLTNYLRTLKAVHSGADLESAVATCMGYNSQGQGFMVGVEIHPVKGLPSGFPELLQFVLDHVEDKEVEPLLEGLLEARVELRPMLLGSHDRLKDLIFLDLALDSAVRTATERSYETLNNAGPQKIMYITGLLLENLALSSDDNEDLIFCLKGWNCASEMLKAKDAHWALYAKSVLDRIRLALTNKAESYHQILQPSAEYLGGLLGVDQWAVNIFTEEIIRAGSAASLSMLLNRIDPILRKEANLGSWQIISPVEVRGTVVVVDELLSVQNKVYDKPTILIAKRVKGEEEIPDGAVAVLTPDMPDVLSHVSVRARNSKVCFATSFDSGILTNIQAMEGKTLYLKPTSSDLLYGELKDAEVFAGKSSALEGGAVPSLTLVPKKFLGKYAISANEFSSEMVGAKSRNIAYLKGKVPSWVGIPTSVALPFGTFEKVLYENENKAVADKLSSLRKQLGDSHGDSQVLHEIRETVLQLSPPSLLVQELKNKMQDSGMPWPGSQGEGRWDRAWEAIKKVWASKWNERAYFSTRKVKLDHDSLCMAVLVQEIINADYAFVIHTTNPSSGDTSEIYAEVVKGLGETLVGAYPGRAVSFTCKKADLDSPKISGYPSKPIGLFIKPSIIFRSDSNGEDLEGYAGAGLYDSVPMDKEEKVVLDYSADPLLTDRNFQKSILSAIARAGSVIEELYGSPQDIEGVVKDGKVFVVQTRPQM